MPTVQPEKAAFQGHRHREKLNDKLDFGSKLPVFQAGPGGLTAALLFFTF